MAMLALHRPRSSITGAYEGTTANVGYTFIPPLAFSYRYSSSSRLAPMPRAYVARSFQS
jgi:hypothetical protein